MNTMIYFYSILARLLLTTASENTPPLAGNILKWHFIVIGIIFGLCLLGAILGAIMGVIWRISPKAGEKIEKAYFRHRGTDKVDWNYFKKNNNNKK